MKLKLAYDNELELSNLPTFKGRVSYIKHNIFNNGDYLTNRKCGKNYTFKEFYNISSPEGRTEIEEEQIVDRWLGVKRVGSPFKDESMKLTMDFVTTYLLSSKDNSVRSEVHEFKVLKNKEVNNSINEGEMKTLEKLNKNIIFQNVKSNISEEETVFYFNKKFENTLKRRFKENDDEKLKEKITTCKNLRGKARKKAQAYNRTLRKIEDIKLEIKNDYQLLKENKKNNCLFHEITSKVKNTRKLKRELHYLEYELKNLADDYYLETELVIVMH